MAPTVVLLHAFPFDRHVWDGVVDQLADAGWDVVVPDLRGFGESAYGEDGPDDEPSLSWMARDVLGILDRLGVSAAVFAGISMGGYVAMEIVRQDPSRVAGIALVDTKATADAEEARVNRLKVADQVLASGSTEALARAMVPTLLGTTRRRISGRPCRRRVGAARDALRAWTRWPTSRRSRCRVSSCGGSRTA
ncbi:MAG: alpha/beta fold hydrolase [Candidatus Nanopelagicales bacterium]